MFTWTDKIGICLNQYNKGGKRKIKNILIKKEIILSTLTF